MDVMQRMSQAAGSLAASEEKVCRVVLDNPEIVESATITLLAERAGTSTSAVQRFCQNMGFKGYKDFRYEVVRHLSSSGGPDASADSVSALATSLGEAVLALADIDRTLLRQLASDIVDSGATYCVGIYRSGLPAEKLRMNLEDLGMVSLCADEPVQMRHLAYAMRPDSCLISFSVTGGATYFRDLVADESVDVGHSWAVTFEEGSWLASHAEHAFVLPRPVGSERGTLDEHAVMVAFVEIVTLAVREELLRRTGTQR